MNEQQFEECSLADATYVEINGRVLMLGGNEVGLASHDGEWIGIRCRIDDTFIPLGLFPILGIKPTREKKPIVFEFTPSLEMVKDSWLGEHIPMEAIGKKFKCIQILKEGKR